MKIISEIELEGSEVVEVVARALYAHVNCPGADYMSVKWPPTNKTSLITYWNKARAVMKAQHAYVVARGPSPLTVGWFAIDTAPREPIDKYGYGPTIFVMVDGQPAIGYWDRDYSNFYMEGRDEMNPQPSHWMPVPEVHRRDTLTQPTIDPAS